MLAQAEVQELTDRMASQPDYAAESKRLHAKTEKLMADAEQQHSEHSHLLLRLQSATDENESLMTQNVGLRSQLQELTRENLRFESGNTPWRGGGCAGSSSAA